jgi:imidazolonepropionase
MAKAGVVAVLLPGTSLYTSIPYTKAKPFKNHHCMIALSTDFNPGSSPISNISFIATIGAIHCGLTLVEALAAVTYIPAISLGLGKHKGTLSPGYDADFSIFAYPDAEHWISGLGQTKPSQVFIKGSKT